MEQRISDFAVLEIFSGKALFANVRLHAQMEVDDCAALHSSQHVFPVEL